MLDSKQYNDPKVDEQSATSTMKGGGQNCLSRTDGKETPQDYERVGSILAATETQTAEESVCSARISGYPIETDESNWNARISGYSFKTDQATRNRHRD